MQNNRPEKDQYYLSIAAQVASRSTCAAPPVRCRHCQGRPHHLHRFNGAGRGEPHCCDVGECYRIANNIPHGQNFEFCRAVHSEMNAIIHGNPSDMVGATLYLAGYENGARLASPQPCLMCSRAIKNAQIAKVVTT